MTSSEATSTFKLKPMQTQLNKIKVAQSPTTNGSPEMQLILPYYASYSSTGTIKARSARTLPYEGVSEMAS